MNQPGSPVGLHRVLAPAGVLPQAADRLDVRRELWPDEVRVRVERLNLDAASFRQLERTHAATATRSAQAVLDIVASRGKMQNPETGSGGMLVGTVEEVGPDSPLGLAVGDRVATLVSLTLTPLVIEDGLARWDGTSEQVPCDGYADPVRPLHRRGAARRPAGRAGAAVMDVCGAPALTARVVAGTSTRRPGGSWSPSIGGGRASPGSLSLAAAEAAGAGAHASASCPHERRGRPARPRRRSPTWSRSPTPATRWRCPTAVDAAGGPADVTVVCVDVPGCEGGAILATADGGTVIFFSMATSFSAAALGAEGLAADVTMLVGNGYVPGHADYALALLRGHAGVRGLFERRL